MDLADDGSSWANAAQPQFEKRRKIEMKIKSRKRIKSKIRSKIRTAWSYS
jgi:hypothetical protein